MADILAILGIIGLVALFVWDDRRIYRDDTYRAIETRQIMDRETLDTMKALIHIAQAYSHSDTHNNSQE